MKKEWLWLSLLPLAVAGCFVLLIVLVENLQQRLVDEKKLALARTASDLSELLADQQPRVDDQSVYRSVGIETRLVLDGRFDDWPALQPEVLGLSYLLEIQFAYTAETLNYELRTGADDRFLYLHYRIMDDFVVYRAVNHPSVHRNDHIQLAFLDSDARFRRFTIAATQPGYVEAMEIGGNGRALRALPQINGRWLATENGYNVELQIPRQLLSDRFSTLVSDVDNESDRTIRCMIGRSHTADENQLGYLVSSPTMLEKMLKRQQEQGELALASFEASMNRLRLQVLVAAGLAMAVALILVMLMARRMHRLQHETQTEIERIRQYNDYLEKMAGRLSHELQTPVSVIRSSIEHLLAGEGEGSVYVDRASEGVQRLATILEKMAEARRLEEALDEDEIIRFNLADVVGGCVEGYRLAWPDVTFDLSIEADDVPVTGIPELLAQAFDKIVDNAVEFSDSTPIRVRLTIEDNNAVLRVMNEGPRLPVKSGDELLESMVSVRDDKGSHLGLGLYVAKTIAEYHGGEIRLTNREDVDGVIATLCVPILRLTARL